MRITPGILSADFTNLRHEIGRISGADGVHVDVMDNRLVPNLTVGFPVVECLRKVANRLPDIHLMIEDPDRWVPAYAEAGAESVAFHIEAAHAPVWLARELRARGARTSMVSKPVTPIEPYAEMLDRLNMMLLMTVEPSFGGQKFLDLVLPKIRRTRGLIENCPIRLQVDGGVLVETIGRCAEASIDTFVVGSAVYNALNPDIMVRELRELVDSAWCC